MSTIASVLWILREDVNVMITKSKKEAMFDSYLTNILSIQSSFNESRDPNSSTTKPLLPLANSSETIIKRNPKNSWLISNPESDDEDDRSTKKQKLLETDMPWHPQAFPQLNGNKFSKEMPSTLTRSSHHSTMLSLMKREQVTWETWKLYLESLRVKNKSLLHQNGLLHGKKLQRPLDLPFSIKKKNYLNTEITLNVNLPLNSSPHITKSYSITLPSATKLPEDNMFNSPMHTDSQNSIQQSFSQMELNWIWNNSTTKDNLTPKQQLLWNL
jgi:hypothetical protein